MPNFWRMVDGVIEEADILLEVLDSRSVDKTRNIEIENKVRYSGKTLIYVFNKCDLVDIEKLKLLKKDLKPSVFVSAKDFEGTKKLREAILKNSGSKKTVFVGVLGYPNTGKSSIINALAGKASAKTSNESGFTKGMQYIRVSQRIKLIDTPGVIPYLEKNENKHGFTSAVDSSKVKDPEGVVFDLMETHPSLVECFYGVEECSDPSDVLDLVSIKLGHLKKGGIPDSKRTARMILKDWQTGKLK